MIHVQSNVKLDNISAVYTIVALTFSCHQGPHHKNMLSGKNLNK